MVGCAAVVITGSRILGPHCCDIASLTVRRHTIEGEQASSIPECLCLMLCSSQLNCARASCVPRCPVRAWDLQLLKAEKSANYVALPAMRDRKSHLPSNVLARLLTF